MGVLIFHRCHHFCNVYGVVLRFCFAGSKRSYKLKTRNPWWSNPNFPTTYGLETLDHPETTTKAKNKLPVITIPWGKYNIRTTWYLQLPITLCDYPKLIKTLPYHFSANLADHFHDQKRQIKGKYLTPDISLFWVILFFI